MLLSVFTVFPSFAEGSGGEVTPQLPDTVSSDAVVTEPSVNIEPEPIQNEVAVAAVASTPVINNKANTTISVLSGVDMSKNDTQSILVVTTLPVQKVEVTIDKSSIVSCKTNPGNIAVGSYAFTIEAKNIGIATVSVKVTSTRGTQTSKQWRTSRQAGQQYQFVSVYSSANRVLDVTSSNIDIYNDNNASYQMFNIERINSGDYQGCYYIRYQDKYVAQDSNNDVKIVTTPSANAVWSFMAVSKGDAVMYDFDYPDSPYDFDTTGSEYIFTYDFANIGYSVSAWTNATAAHAYTRLQSTDVFVFTGHGAPGLIAFNEDKSTGIGDICANSAMGSHTLNRYINNISDGSLDKLRCVMLMGCNTGNTTETGYNLVDAIYQKGAHFVMGATEIMYIDTDDDFMKYFFEGLNNGKSIYDAYQYVDEKVDNFYIGIRKDGKKDSVRVSVDHYPGYYVGDTKQYLS